MKTRCYIASLVQLGDWLVRCFAGLAAYCILEIRWSFASLGFLPLSTWRFAGSSLCWAYCPYQLGDSLVLRFAGLSALINLVIRWFFAILIYLEIRWFFASLGLLPLSWRFAGSSLRWAYCPYQIGDSLVLRVAGLLPQIYYTMEIRWLFALLDTTNINLEIG